MVLVHDDHPQFRGYYSKIYGRKIVTHETGSKSTVIWDQTLPVGGFIVPHHHECEESLLFLGGTVEVTVDGKTYLVGANTTVFVPAGAIHSIKNIGSEPARLIAFFPTNKHPEVIYETPPTPVDWDENLGPEA